MKNDFSNKYSIEDLIKLFRRKSADLFLIEPPVGNGSIQVFRLARGLEAWLWNCSFNYEIQLVGTPSPQARSRFFTLLCFLDTPGFRLSHSETLLKEDIHWNTAFLSSTCPYKMQISPNVYRRCLSISFSESWLRHTLLRTQESISGFRRKLSSLEKYSFVGTLKESERRMVKEVMDFSWKKWFGTFYIKSMVLKIVSDLLYRIKQRESFSINHLCLETRVPEIEKYITKEKT
jgi:hypothetical protein